MATYFISFKEPIRTKAFFAISSILITITTRSSMLTFISWPMTFMTIRIAVNSWKHSSLIHNSILKSLLISRLLISRLLISLSWRVKLLRWVSYWRRWICLTWRVILSRWRHISGLHVRYGIWGRWVLLIWVHFLVKLFIFCFIFI